MAPQREALEGHRTLRRRRVADDQCAVAHRGEVERPAMLAREPLHVGRGGIDEMVDETDALGEAQHTVGQAIADVTGNLGGIAQFDERLEQARDGRARQARFVGQRRDRPVRAPAQGLENHEAAADRLDGSHAGRYSVLRILST